MTVVLVLEVLNLEKLEQGVEDVHLNGMDPNPFLDAAMRMEESTLQTNQ